MPRGVRVDIDLLHGYLHRKSDRLGRVKIQQGDLAELLGVTKFTMSRVIAGMVSGGRLRKLANDRHNQGVFVVIDPVVWAAMRSKEENRW